MSKTARSIKKVRFDRWINRLAKFFVLSIVPTFMAGCAKQETAPATVVQVQTAEAMPKPISQHVTADAVLTPIAQAAISPKIAGPVQKFYVTRGSKVKKGELLAVLDNEDLSAAALDSKGNYEQAQAAYSTATKASIPESYQKAALDTEEAEANLDVAQKVYDSRDALFKQGAIPGRDLFTSRASLVQAQSVYNIAKTHLASVKAVSRANALKLAAGQLVSAEGKYQGAEALLHFSEIRSPIDGVVTDRPLFAGETAPPGAPLITVMDVSTLLAKTHLPQEQARLLKLGQPASVQVEGMDQPVTGIVSLVSPALDSGSTTVEVWVNVPNKSGVLEAGTPARVSIVSKTIASALVIPKEAILTTPAGKRVAMVIDASDVAHQRQIETGITDGSEVQVVRGLKDGEHVVTNGAYAMENGTKVVIITGNGSGGVKASAKSPDGGD